MREIIARIKKRSGNMIKCPRCNGRKYIELDKVGLLVTVCPDCKGTGLVAGDPDPQRPESLAPGLFWCSKCNAPHREGSKTGQRHLKFKVEV